MSYETGHFSIRIWRTSRLNFTIQDSHITTPPWLETIYGPLILTSLRSIECPVGLNTSEIAAIIAYCLVSEMDLIQATH